MERYTHSYKYKNHLKNGQGRRMKIGEPLRFALFNVPTSKDLGKSSTDLDGSFLWSQLLIDTLLHMSPSDRSDRNALAQLCRNEAELVVMNELQQTYSSDRAIWWYSRETFLYRLLNQAFREHVIYLLYLFRFFICDLYQELEKLHSTQNKLFAMRVYRAQLITIDELESIESRIGQYLAMNSFLSTTLDYEYAMFLLESLTFSNPNKTLTTVLFEIDVEGIHTEKEETRKLFAEITQHSAMSDEQEVLFTPSSVFRLTGILHQRHTSYTNIRMSFCSATDAPLSSIFHFRQRQLETQGYNCMTLGKICWQMGRFDHAELFFRKALEDPKIDKALCLRNLANAMQDRGDYSTSIRWYAKSLKLENQMPFDVLADTYNSIGVVFYRMGHIKLSRQTYTTAMRMWIQAYGRDCEQLADYYNNMGVIYFAKNNYWRALRQYRTSLTIRQKYRPPDHPYIAATQINIANIHTSLGQLDRAAQLYAIALNILRRAIPPDHPITLINKRNISIISAKNEESYELHSVLCHFRQF